MLTNQSNISDEERQDGDLGYDSQDPLSIKLSDEEIIRIIGKRVEDSEQFWNRELKLDEVRKRSEKYWLNDSVDESDLYEYQIPYKNNRMLVDIETLLAVVLMQKAEPMVMEAQDTDASRQLAQDLQTVLLGLYEDLYLKQKLTLVARHLLVGLRLGVLKYRWNPYVGMRQPDGSMSGAIEVSVVRPQRVVLEEGSSDPDNVGLVAEYIPATIEELVNKYPDKKDELFRQFGISRGVRTQMARQVGYMEIWFEFYDENGDKKSATCWKCKDVVLDKMLNPNWKYSEKDPITGEEITPFNFFDRAKHPYIFFNHLNLGKHAIDDTSLAEQAQPLQDILNKRGRQIVENADQATAGLVGNKEMISEESLSKLTGDPGEKIMVAGDVNKAVSRLPYNPLPNYVVQDKTDARNEIDNMFGANAAIRGEVQKGDQTLGETVLSQRANMGRSQTIADSLENGMDKLYKALTQMIVVFWDEPQKIRYVGQEGKTTFTEFSSGKIEPGTQVRVKAGSLIPRDKVAERQATMQLAQMLDPLSLAEGLDKPNPKEFAKRLVLFRADPARYMAEVLEMTQPGTDQQAMADIQAILGGQPVQPPQAPSQEYVLTIDQFISSQTFKDLPPEQQQTLTEFARAVLDTSKGAIQEPTDQVQPQATQPQNTGATVPNPQQGATVSQPPQGFLGKVKSMIGMK